MTQKSIRLAVISDLHYRRHASDIVCRTANASQGSHSDPMDALFKLISDSNSNEMMQADYLLCPGDITDKAGADPFHQAWKHLKDLKEKLGCQHIIASTGNHEVDSRVGKEQDQAGNVEIETDPLKTLQKLPDYPSTALASNDRRWVYWGRGYEMIELPDALILLINSSHYHSTTRIIEYERGRIGDVALDCLRQELEILVKKNKNRAFIALLHHHPIPHQDLDIELGKIEMANGSRLIQLLSSTDVSWLIIHGHKHHARLITAQGGATRPVVFAAGSFGAQLDGALATKTRTQFYIANILVEDQTITAKVTGNISAWSWSGSEWVKSTKIIHGLPDGCGFKIPDLNLEHISDKVYAYLAESEATFASWAEAVISVPDLKHLMPDQIKLLRKIFDAKGIKSTWQDENWFPTEVSK